jgi:alkylated DNA repair protein alkB family protein 8
MAAAPLAREGYKGLPGAPMGLELFPHMVEEATQAALLEFVDSQLTEGRAGHLPGSTYLIPPPEWRAAGQSREMLQYGVFTKCNRVEPAHVAPLPAIFEDLLDSFEQSGVIAPGERPEACTVNLYDKGCWLPPHVDNLAFSRPFFTVSLRSAQSVVFGSQITGEQGDWEGSCHLLMPVGSVLRVDGEAGGPPCLHALPRATAPRVSLTFRRLTDEIRQKFATIRLAAEESARVRRERKRQAKLARGKTPRHLADEAAAAARKATPRRGNGDEETEVAPGME